MVERALSAEEWAEVPRTGYDGFFGDVYLWHGKRHGLAAACLYGQPFGFTRQDVEALRLLGSSRLFQALGDTGMTTEAFCSSLADRIEALLPEEGAG